MGMFRTIGQIKFLETNQAIAALSITCLAGFALLVRSKLSKTQLAVLSVFLCILVHSAVTSRYVGVSLIFAYYAVCSAMLYIILSHADLIDSQIARSGDDTLNNTSYSATGSLLNVAKLAFIFCACLHAIALVIFYIYLPKRTFGLMDDYSQASMILLLAYGMAYPIFKEKSFFSAFSLILFVAYFTTFSRTANLLLVMFFIALFIYERRNNNSSQVLKLAGLAVAAVLLVNVYPSLLNEATVDRGGLAHFSTLNSRTLYWGAAWEGILSAPFKGHGLGMYAWTGVKESVPFNNIYFVHNDYLQVIHDLGVFWGATIFGTLFYILVKFAPIDRLTAQRPFISISQTESRQFLGWTLMVLIAAYMSINFLIVSLEFQAAIAILLVDTLRK